jgi:polyisoprenoid-binding protein YceI
MKSLIGRIKSGFLNASLSIALFALISPAAYAAGGKWSLDSTGSDARFFQGSAANPDSTNTGVARVSGQVNLNSDDLNNSVVDLNIFPADEDWEHTVSSAGDLPTGFVPDASEHTLLTFRAKRILRARDGKVAVSGDLTLTRVDRPVTMSPNEAYAGPVYGDPVIHTETREVTFLFKNDDQDLSGSARVIHEDFPELLTTIQSTNWPTVVQNETCQMPSTVGEDYHGATCTGTVIEATHNDNCQIPASGGAEGYIGPVCTPPAGDGTTIVLNLKLRQTSSEPSAETFSAVGASR